MDDEGGRVPAADPPASSSPTGAARRSYARPAALVVAGVALVTAGSVAVANLLSSPPPTARVLATVTTSPGPVRSLAAGTTLPPTAPSTPAAGRTPPPTPRPSGGSGSTTPAPVQLPAAPSPSTCAGDPGSCADGRPGWSGSFGSCRDAAAGDVPAATARGELFDGLTATFSLPADTVRAGQTLAGVLTLHSTRSDRVSLVLTPAGGDPARVYGARGGALHSDDTIASAQVELGPGQSLALDLPVQTTSCADTFEQPEPALPAGRYDAGRTFEFRDAHVVAPGSSGSPSAAPSASSSPASPTPAQSAGPSASPVPSDGLVALRLAFTIT